MLTLLFYGFLLDVQEMPRCIPWLIVAVRSGKGNKDRMLPVGERALSWLEKYQADGRDELISPQDG